MTKLLCSAFSAASEAKLQSQMQSDNTSSTANGATSSPLKSQPQSDDAQSASFCSAIFDPKPSLAPYDTGSDSDATSTRRRHKLYHSVLVQDHQEMVNRHSLCLKSLHEEADALRRGKNLNLLIHLSLQKQFGSSSAAASVQRTPFGIVNAFLGLTIDAKGDEEVSDESPTSVIKNEDSEHSDVERFSLPKSISVRSNVYAKGAQAGASNAAARTRTPSRLRTATTFNASSQKVYVRGGMKQEVPLELEVYNRGKFKTELCNIWQECPYGDHCQFAHGIEELRPVIGHPLYKTEVCRMLLAGVVCLNGHRCHFRPALTDELKFMGHNKPRPLKPDSLCLKRLHEEAEEADVLHTLNLELNNLTLLINASLQKQFGSSSGAASLRRTPFGIVNAFRGLSIDTNGDVGVSEENPTNVNENESEDSKNADMEGFSLPKSMSARNTDNNPVMDVLNEEKEEEVDAIEPAETFILVHQHLEEPLPSTRCLFRIDTNMVEGLDDLRVKVIEGAQTVGLASDSYDMKLVEIFFNPETNDYDSRNIHQGRSDSFSSFIKKVFHINLCAVDASSRIQSGSQLSECFQHYNFTFPPWDATPVAGHMPPWMNSDNSINKAAYISVMMRALQTEVLRNPLTYKADAIRAIAMQTELEHEACVRLVKVMIMDKHLRLKVFHRVKCVYLSANLHSLRFLEI